MGKEKIDTVKVSAIIIAIALASYFLVYPALVDEVDQNGIPSPSTKPSSTPNSSWWLISNLADQYHIFAIDILTSKYGVSKKDWSEGLNWNTEGQSLILIGGSDELMIEASWIKTPKLSIMKPSTQPKVWFSWNSLTETWTIMTPKNSYVASEADDYGFVSYAYCSTLKRYVYVAIGYSGPCTIAGALILKNQILTEGSYMIYKLTASPIAEPWVETDYSWTIVETS